MELRSASAAAKITPCIMRLCCAVEKLIRAKQANRGRGSTGYDSANVQGKMFGGWRKTQALPKMQSSIKNFMAAIT